jgi:hypothetical protein
MLVRVTSLVLCAFLCASRLETCEYRLSKVVVNPEEKNSTPITLSSRTSADATAGRETARVDLI